MQKRNVFIVQLAVHKPPLGNMCLLLANEFLFTLYGKLIVLEHHLGSSIYCISIGPNRTRALRAPNEYASCSTTRFLLSLSLFLFFRSFLVGLVNKPKRP